MGAAPIGQIAPQGLAAVEAVAVNAAYGHEGRGFGDDHFSASRRQGQANAEFL